MEVPEPPECPVCLGQYDAGSTVPRVLSCGHSTCEACLSQLPNPFPSTIRCPSCTQLVKLPSCPSILPKNIDLLRLSSSLQSHAKEPEKVIPPSPPPSAENKGSDIPFMRNLWSHDFYLKWKNWVIPKDFITMEINSESNENFSVWSGKISESFVNSYYRCILRENEKVGLVKVGIFRSESEKKEEKEGSLSSTSSKFKYSCEAKILKVLYLMKESEINEVSLVLNASSRIDRVGRIYGFWCNEEDDSVYIVFQGFSGGLVKSILDLENGFLGSIEDQGEEMCRMVAFGMLGMEMCEVLSDLHVEGLVVGCLGVSCFSLNQFGRVFVDIVEVLRVGMRVCSMINRINDVDVMMLETMELQNCVFVSPEVLFELLTKEGVELGDGRLKYEVGYESDIWSLACVLISLLVGKLFGEEICKYYCSLFTAITDRKGFDYVDFYTGWMERIVPLLEGRLGSEFVPLKEILCECLSLDPGNRPVVTDLRKCIGELVVKQEFHLICHSEIELSRENSCHCMVLGSLCQIATKTEKGKIRKMSDALVGKDKNGGKDVDQVEESGVDADVVEGFSNGNFKCIDLKGHFDSVTGLAVGGDFLFSSSHDKIVNVWSLQDFSHVHSFKGHEDRVTAVVSVDGGEPLCISADKGGVICVWGAKRPLRLTPMMKLFEPKDWRYSGIHALAISGTQYLYTGSGDRSIKAWSLQDYTLTCTMTGHKSVVSSLAVCNGVLYSGSWDGTVRLWSLSDHNPLAILGEDIPLTSVLSLAADDNMLVVAHENGSIKIWYNDVLLNSREVHDGAVISVCKMGKWLFTGGWDKTINIQALCRDGNQVEAMLTGSISSDSVITSLAYWQGKLVVGQANKVIKVYSFGE